MVRVSDLALAFVFTVALASCKVSLNSDGATTTSDGVTTETTQITFSGNVELMIGNTAILSCTGGTEPYSYSMVSGGGSINSDSGLYTAPSTAGSDVLKCTDMMGESTEVTVTINAQIAFTAATATKPAVYNGTTYNFAVEGGVAPYSYSIVSGPGAISSSGVFTGDTTVGHTTIRVTDFLGNTADTTLGSLGDVKFALRASDIDGGGDGNSELNNGDKVETWASQFGSESATNGTEDNRPDYVTSSSGYNNLPTVEFSSEAQNGTDDQCLVFVNDMNSGEDLTASVVGDSLGGSIETYYTNYNTGLAYFSLGSLANTVGLGAAYDGSDLLFSGTGNATDPHLGFMWVDGSADQLLYLHNGSGTLVNNGNYDPVDMGVGTKPVVGAATSDCATAPLTGEIAELILWERALSTAESYNLHCYWQDLYGITTSNACPYE